VVKFCDNCGKPIEDDEINYHTSPFGKTISVCNKCYKNYERKSVRKEKNNRSTLKKISVILVVILILSFVFVNGHITLNKLYDDLVNEIKNLQNDLKETGENLNDSKLELNLLNSNYENKTENLNENLTEIESLKSGNEYQLHDPLYDEVITFIDSDNSEDERILTEKAKTQGINCAFVVVNIVGSNIVIVGEDPEGASYSLAAFNTLDEGMVYFEAQTDYRVSPEIGKKYTDCVEGKPYWSDFMVNDTITDILLIW
jgi:hypothetical protein